MISSLFSASHYMPHGHCYLWEPDLVWTMVIFDSLIGLAYVVISAVLYAFVRKTKLPFRTVFFAFGLFILACGATHFMEVYTLWLPHYWLDAVIKGITAVASVATAIYVIRLFPRVTELTAAGLELAEARAGVEEFFQKRLSAPPEVRRILNRALILPIGLAIALILVAGFEAAYLSISQDWVDHSTTVIINAQNLKGHISEAQDEFRSFWFTGEKDFITGYQSNENEADKMMAALEKLVQESPSQVEKIRGVRRDFQTWQDYVKKNPLPEPTVPHRDAIEKFLAHTLELRRQVRGDLDKFISDERGIRSERAERTKLLASIVLVTVALLVVLIAVFGVLTRNMLRHVSQSYGRALEFERQSREKSEEALASRDEFLSIASHELKTPLTSLKLQLQLLGRSEDPRHEVLKSKISESVDVGLRQINSLTSLIDDILDTTRLNAGHFPLIKAEADISQVVEDVANRFAAPLEAAHCKLKLELEKPIVGHWDVRRLEQVVANLLSNAIKYAPGQPIHISTSQSNGKAIISVRDFGLGIEKHMQTKIFERFQRGNTPKVVGGLGLGLYIVRGIVESKGGTIRVESEPGKGARFVVELPIT